MSGRYALTAPPDAVREWFGYAERPDFPPRYNIAPTQPVAVVRRGPDGRPEFMLMRWGFVPGFVREPARWPLVINIRAETAPERPAFRGAWRHRRCAMPVDGFYEWQRLSEKRGPGTSRPLLVRRRDRSLFAFAALWETWAGPDGSEVDTVALLNTDANATLAAIHTRCPVLLTREGARDWLDPALPSGRLAELMRPPPDAPLEMIAVSARVNAVANDDPGVQEPVVAEPVVAEPVPSPGPAVQGRLL